MTECIAILKDKFGRLEYKQELIRCEDCTYYYGDVKFPYCCYHEINVQQDCDYCSWAKRKVIF